MSWACEFRGGMSCALYINLVLNLSLATSGYKVHSCESLLLGVSCALKSCPRSQLSFKPWKEMGLTTIPPSYRPLKLREKWLAQGLVAYRRGLFPNSKFSSLSPQKQCPLKIHSDSYHWSQGKRCRERSSWAVPPIARSGREQERSTVSTCAISCLPVNLQTATLGVGWFILLTWQKTWKKQISDTYIMPLFFKIRLFWGARLHAEKW